MFDTLVQGLKGMIESLIYHISSARCPSFSRHLRIGQGLSELHCDVCRFQNSLVDVHNTYISSCCRNPVIVTLLLEFGSDRPHPFSLGDENGTSPGRYLSLVTGRGVHSTGEYPFCTLLGSRLEYYSI